MVKISLMQVILASKEKYSNSFVIHLKEYVNFPVKDVSDLHQHSLSVYTDPSTDCHPKQCWPTTVKSGDAKEDIVCNTVALSSPFWNKPHFIC